MFDAPHVCNLKNNAKQHYSHMGIEPRLRLLAIFVTLYNNDNFMELVTLKFSTAKKLWTFRLELEATDLKVDLKQRTLTCHCSPKDIKRAIEQFDATLLMTSTANTPS